MSVQWRVGSLGSAPETRPVHSLTFAFPSNASLARKGMGIGDILGD
jgi:hypothetical protein